MIKKTFSFVSGITAYREKMLNQQGISCWDDFLSNDYIEGISCRKKDYYDQQIMKAERNLEYKNHHFFYENLPRNDHWRLYDHLRKQCAFLDIETTGLSRRANRVTTVSIFDGKNTETFINGVNLKSNALNDALKRFKMLVTFNGAMFDVPFIQEHFPRVSLAMPHMDLRWVAKRAGFTGGLKSIEKQLGISRDDNIKDITGMDAVRLWKRWELHGDKDALDTLVRYNQEDVINLKTLADHVYGLLSKN